MFLFYVSHPADQMWVNVGCTVCPLVNLVFWSLCVGSCLYVRLINWVTQTEGENTAKGRERGREGKSERKCERAMLQMHAYSLPVWLWRTVTLFGWLVEPLGRDWACYIILPLSSSFLSSLIYQSNSYSVRLSTLWLYVWKWFGQQFNFFSFPWKQVSFSF